MVNQSRSLLLADLTQQESENIRPGLLSVFRMMIGLQLIITIVALALIKMLRPELNLAPVILWSIGWMGLLIGYLSWGSLQRKLGHWYLPIALVVTTTAPILPRIRALYASMEAIDPVFSDSEFIANGWRLSLALIVPLVFVAWQYRFRYVFFYSTIVTILNLTTGFFIFDVDHPLWPEVVDQSLTSGVIFLIIGYVITRLVRAQQEKQQALAMANAQLVDFASTAEQLATSRERNRLARDLHDTLAHTLSSISIQLEAVDSAIEHSPERAREMLGKTLINTRGGLNETRRALRALRASPLDDLGLALAVRKLAESTAARNRIELSIDIPHDELKLAPLFEQNIYRITQESIENIIQHANAQNFCIALKQLNGTTILEIEDDGEGFQLGDPYEEGHYGLQGMRERAELIGANLFMESHAGQGTTLRLTLKKEPGEKR